MRPSRTVARAALTAALALGSLPGLVGSHEPSSDGPIDPAAFRQVILANLGNRPAAAVALSSDAEVSDGALAPDTTFIETGPRTVSVGPRARVALPAVSPAWSWKPPKATMTGYASFYSF